MEKNWLEFLEKILEDPQKEVPDRIREIFPKKKLLTVLRENYILIFDGSFGIFHGGTSDSIPEGTLGLYNSLHGSFW